MTKEPGLFLTDEELYELTGIGNGRTDMVAGVGKKRSRLELQVEQLRKMGVPFHVNARGRPMIARAYFAGQRSDPQPRPKTQPRALMSHDVSKP